MIRDNLGRFVKGTPSPNKGKKLSPLTEEHKEKIRKSLLGRKFTEEWKKKIGLATTKRLTGVKKTEEWKRKVSMKLKGNKNSLGYRHTLETRSKMSKSHIGMRLSDEVKKKISDIRKKDQFGNNNPCWKGGISFEPYPLGWTRTYKEQVRQRDGYKCQLCGCPEVENGIKLSVHHIDYDKTNLSLYNLISLCRCCHSKTVTNRKYYRDLFMEKLLCENY